MTARTVLAVCTGNICRSPAVERYLSHRLGPDAGLAIASAGVAADVGAPVSGPMATLLRAAGVDDTGFAARQVTEAMLRDADLVVALDRGHRARLVALAPATVRRTFTLRELARLAGTVDPALLPPGYAGERLAALLPLLRRQPPTRPTSPADDDVADPYGRGDAAYRSSWALVRAAVDALIPVLRPDERG